MNKTIVKECIVKVQAHLYVTDAVQALFRRYKTTTIVIPGGCTSVLQPLEVSITYMYTH